MSVIIEPRTVTTPDLVASRTVLVPDPEPALKVEPGVVVEKGGTARLPAQAKPGVTLTSIESQAPGAMLADKVRGIYDANGRAKVYINRLLDGYSMEEVTKELTSEIKFNDSRIRIMEDQKKKSRGHLGSRQHYFNHVLSKRPQLAEVGATLELLRGTADWQRWFDDVPDSPLHVVTRFECCTTVRGFLELTQLKVRRDSIRSRHDKLSKIVDLLTTRYPRAAERLRQAWQQPEVQKGLLGTRNLETLQLRLTWLVQTCIKGELSVTILPGDGRVVERPHRDGPGAYYFNAAIPSKDIVIMRNHNFGKQRESADRFQSAQYDFYFCGVTPKGPNLVAWPSRRAQQRVVGVEKDGCITRGSSYEQYFSRFGVELPERVPPAQVADTIHAIDAYLAGTLTSVDLSLQITMMALISGTLSKR
jgi:hypothetical protein